MFEKVGFKLLSDGRCMEEETPYLMVLRGSQIIDISLTPKETKTGYITPIVGVEGGRFIEYDRRDRIIYWLQSIITNFLYFLFCKVFLRSKFFKF